MSAGLRLLRVDPAAMHGPADLRRACDAGRRLGFEQLSLAWSPGAAAPTVAALVDDGGGAHDRMNGQAADDGSEAAASQGAGRAVAGFAAACREHGLGLFIDVQPGRVHRAGPAARQHPGWFERPAGADLPDPRRPAHWAMTSRLRTEDPAALAEALAWWTGQLNACLDAGVNGFHCVHEDGLPPAFWQALVAAVRAGRPQACFVAAPPEAAPLLDGGFDAMAWAVPATAAEVERRVEEHDRICVHAAPLALLGEARRHPVCSTTPIEDAEPAHRRSLWWAAAAGTGWMMPLGFERGLPPGQALAADGAPGSAADFDLGEEVRAVNAWMAERAGRRGAVPRLALLSAAEAPAVALLVGARGDPQASDRAMLLLAGFPGATHVAGADVLPAAGRFTRFRALKRLNGNGGAGPAPAADGFDAAATLELPPGTLALYESVPAEPAAGTPTRAAATANRARRALELALKAPRVAIEHITPCVDGGRFPVKRVAGEAVRVEADVFMDGHDKLAAVLLWRGPDELAWREVPMTALGNDRWRAEFPLTRLGRHAFTVEAWRDAWQTYRDELGKKVAAGLDVRLEVEEGRLLLVETAEHARGRQDTAAAEALDAIVRSLGTPLAGKAAKTQRRAAANAGFAADAAGAAPPAGTPAPAAPPGVPALVEILLADGTQQAVRAACLRPFALRAEPALCVDAERTAARYASWYELFPRSLGNRPGQSLRHGRFDDVIERLPAIREMGFDVLYFTPIHPIGKTNRKGRNNTLTPGPDDPGSPYAIGSEEGGHDAIHRELGTLEDFLRLCSAAQAQGLEIALDFAIQCSPDHPWLQAHPEWFSWRPDGSMRYAENPPKKYQDIVNVDFYAEGARPALWTALRDVVLFWVKQGVRLFRVDNPHTKPLPFWEWMIGDVRTRHPDVVFLSEAFTRPKPMLRLAKVGFSQSYTYFTWRHTKQEFTDYLTELNQPPASEVLRPHFFVNTPDINPHFLQRSGRAGFLIRAALATTLSGLWGMYSGFELCEGTPLPGKEEYLDSEKFELRAWDWDRPGHIKAEITRLNRIRRANPALQTHLGVEFFNAANDQILWFAKTVPSQVERNGGRFGRSVVLVAINLDPHHVQEADVELPLWRFGLPDDGTLDAVDLLHDHRFAWQGKHQHLRLDPAQLPYAIWRVQPREAG